MCSERGLGAASLRMRRENEYLGLNGAAFGYLCDTIPFDMLNKRQQCLLACGDMSTTPPPLLNPPTRSGHLLLFKWPQRLS